MANTFLLLFFFIMTILLSYSSPSSAAINIRTDPSDIAALLAFKSSISPPSINPWSCLSSWNFSSDPCHPQLPTHFTCGLSCTSSPSFARVSSITLDPAGYSGTLSPSISKLPLLAHLNLFDNSFHGPIPPSFPSSLQTLVLSSNSFSGPIPGSISKLSNLETLDLSRNGLTGPVPDSLSPNLAFLDLSFNSLSGPLPNSLPPNLLELALRGNSISGFVKKSTFQPLKYLEVVELAANQIGGKVEGWFFLLPSLQQVDLANNSIRALQVWGPTTMTTVNGGAGGGERLVAVDLSFNEIEGELPAEFAAFPSMAALSARHNRLTGQIPWQYKKMRRLFLDGNFLNGQVPDEILKGGEVSAGSFGDNCLDACPESTPLCSPVQKPDWVCKQVYGAGSRRRRPSSPAVN